MEPVDKDHKGLKVVPGGKTIHHDRAEKQAQQAEEAEWRRLKRIADEEAKDHRAALREKAKLQREADRAQAKFEKEMKKIEAKEEAKATLIDAARQFIDENPMCFIARLDRYIVERPGSEPVFLKNSSMDGMFYQWSKEFKAAVAYVMAERGLNYLDATYTYAKNVPATTKNLLSTDNWIKPVEPGPEGHHAIFDALIESLGDSKTENMDHIEHCIASKYMYPENFNLPALLIGGEGGRGRNLGNDRVCYTIFGGQTKSMKSDHVVGNFNSLVKAQAIVMLNEGVAESETNAAIKDSLHKERLVINEKGVPQYEVANTPWYWIAWNMEGSVYLDRTDADRRYSVLFCEQGKTLVDFLAAQPGWDKTRAKLALTAPDGEAHVAAGDPIEVGKWLYYLLAKHGHRPKPTALHGADYHRLLGQQMRVDEQIAQAVFTDPDFTHISAKVLYQGYRLHQGKLGSRKFKAAIESYIKKAGLPITYEDFRTDKTTYGGHVVRRPSGTKIQVRNLKWVKVAPDAETVRKADNDDTYVVRENYRDQWIGPEVD